MRVGITIGDSGGAAATLDLEELLATRLLVQGNSGSGKSHLLRRLLEQSAEFVQQVIIDPEGDFVTLADRYGHVVVDPSRSEQDLQRIARRVRQHRVSVVLTLEELDPDEQLRAGAAFLNGLFDVDRDSWFPILVVVDEAQLFAPSAASEGSEDARRLSLAAMTNLMCRGRKRGLAGVIATQRLAKLAKNVAAEASNFLMGRTFLDIDMARAADLLGMERWQADMFRDLPRGQFVGLGPALSRRPLPITIGAVETLARSGSPVLMPLPQSRPEATSDLVFGAGTEDWDPPARPSPVRTSTADVLVKLANYRRPVPPPIEEQPSLSPAELDAAVAEIVRDLVAEAGAQAFKIPALYQDFVMRCRMRRIAREQISLVEFTRRLAIARSGASQGVMDRPEWAQALTAASELPDDLQGVFLLIARTAIEAGPCPSDQALAEAYGTQSPGRVRRLLAYLEERGFLLCRTDFRGQRTLFLPRLDLETAPVTRDTSSAALGLAG